MRWDPESPTAVRQSAIYDSTPWSLLADVRDAEVGFDRLQSRESRERSLAMLRDAWADLDAWYAQSADLHSEGASHDSTLQEVT